MSRRIILVFSVLAAAASSTARAAYWMDAAVCDNGQVKVQIDAGERRSMQLVVDDGNIKHYFVQELTAHRDDDNGFIGSLYNYFQMNPNNTANTDASMVVHGWNDVGVFRIEQFSNFHEGAQVWTSGVYTCGPYSGGCGDTGPAIDVTRYGDGLKVQIWRPRFYGQYCVAQDSYTMECTQYASSGGWEAREIANWWFSQCDWRQLLP